MRVSSIKLEDCFNDIKIAFETDNPYDILKACKHEYEYIWEYLLQFKTQLFSSYKLNLQNLTPKDFFSFNDQYCVKTLSQYLSHW